MRISICSLLVILFFSVSTSAQRTPPLVSNPKYYLGITAGYTHNFGVNVYGTIADFSYDIPLALKLSAGYNVRDAGNPWDARKVFINDNTDGDPDKSGHSIDLRLDFAYPVNILSLKKTFLFFGPRYSMYTATFEFVGGNEFFDITTSQFGLGTGLETYFGITPNLSLVFSGGFDFYFDSQIGGHDSFYNPDGTDISGREGFDFKDAADAINQPKYEFRLLVGLNFSL